LFGGWADPYGALDKWLAQEDDLLAGREPRTTGDGLTVDSLVQQFLETKDNLRKTGELTERSLEDYKLAGTKLIEVVGRNRPVTDLRPDDFEKLRTESTKANQAKVRSTIQRFGNTTKPFNSTRRRIVCRIQPKVSLT
jgi:hypothetical protein